MRVTGFSPGTFCWADLSTTDQRGATAFYASLFGWETEDVPAGGGQTYTMCRVGGRDVAAVSAMGEAEGSHVPAHWNAYVKVSDAERSAKSAATLGGRVIAQPFDVMDAGRMAVVQDPTGAVLCLWEAGSSHGAGLVGEAGSIGWNDLATHDPDSARRFYMELFEWETEELDVAGRGSYTVFRAGRVERAGMYRLGPQTSDAPPHWTVHFCAADLDAALKSIAALGGRTAAPPLNTPQGRSAVALDPQGASFAVLAPAG